MRQKDGVDISELRHSLPDGCQTSQCRFVAVVERGIRLAAQALQLVGATEDSFGAFEIFVLTSTQPGFLELLHLEFQQVEAGGFLALVHLK